MTASVVNYMLQQGYKPSQLVVLTPYLGQLLELHKELRKTDEQVRHHSTCPTPFSHAVMLHTITRWPRQPVFLIVA